MILNLILLIIIFVLLCLNTRENFTDTYIEKTLPHNHNFRTIVDMILQDINNRYNINYSSGSIERVDIKEDKKKEKKNLNMIVFLYEINYKITIKTLINIDIDKKNKITINSIDKLNSQIPLNRSQISERTSNGCKTGLGKYKGNSISSLDYTLFNEKNKSDKMIVNRTNNLYDDETLKIKKSGLKQFPCRNNQHVWDTLGVHFIEGETNKCMGIYSGASSKKIVPQYNPTIFVRNEDSYKWLFDVASDSASRPVGITGASGSSI